MQMIIQENFILLQNLTRKKSQTELLIKDDKEQWTQKKKFIPYLLLTAEVFARI
jgi:hypothetical protein